MTNKKFKNANLIINTDYADDCEFYGERIVAKAADTFGVDDTVALIDLIEECLLDKMCIRDRSYKADVQPFPPKIIQL